MFLPRERVGWKRIRVKRKKAQSEKAISEANVVSETSGMRTASRCKNHWSCTKTFWHPRPPLPKLCFASRSSRWLFRRHRFDSGPDIWLFTVTLSPEARVAPAIWMPGKVLEKTLIGDYTKSVWNMSACLTKKAMFTMKTWCKERNLGQQVCSRSCAGCVLVTSSSSKYQTRNMAIGYVTILYRERLVSWENEECVPISPHAVMNRTYTTCNRSVPKSCKL
jgi:hypothetical protein